MNSESSTMLLWKMNKNDKKTDNNNNNNNDTWTICASVRSIVSSFIIFILLAGQNCPIWSLCVPFEWSYDHHLSIRILILLRLEPLTVCAGVGRIVHTFGATANVFQTNNLLRAVDVFSTYFTEWPPFLHIHECGASFGIVFAHFGGRAQCSCVRNISVCIFRFSA